MKRAAAFLAALLAVPAVAQDAPIEPMSVRPQATVVVREHTNGADIVEVTMLDPKYPPRLLHQQMLRLAELAGSNARGLNVYVAKLDEKNPRLNFVKAYFGTDNLIDRPNGVLKLNPIVRAFAGAPEPYTVKAISINFQGERPNEHTVQRFRNESIALAGNYIAPGELGPSGIEYRVALLTQDPNAIQIPDRAEKPKPVEPTRAAGPSIPWIAIALFAVGSLAAGALVYFLMIGRGRPRG